MKTNYLTPNNRPLTLQQNINSAFNKISSNYSSQWKLYNGRDQYAHFNVDEAYIVLHLIKSNPLQKEFSIMEVGAGNFQFGRYIAKFINEKIDLGKLQNDISINIISLRGESNNNPEYTKLKNCNIWELGSFKIENLINELANRELHDILSNKVDLIVSNYCLLHLVDPLTTFIQMYNVLKNFGIMLTDTFDFKLNIFDNNNIKDTVRYGCIDDLLPYIYQSSSNKDKILLKYGSDDRGFPRIAIEKHSQGGLKIPFQYEHNNLLYQYEYDNDHNHYKMSYYINLNDMIKYTNEQKHMIGNTMCDIFSWSSGGKVSGDYELFQTLSKALLTEQQDEIKSIQEKIIDNKNQLVKNDTLDNDTYLELLEDYDYRLKKEQSLKKCVDDTKQCITTNDTYETGGLFVSHKIIFAPEHVDTFDLIKLAGSCNENVISEDLI